MKNIFFSIDWRNKKIIFPMNHKCCEKKSSDIWYCEKKTLLFKSRRESYIVIMSEHKQTKIFFFSIGMRNKKIIFPMKHKTFLNFTSSCELWYGLREYVLYNYHLLYRMY
jgi:hypothetical protein